MSTPHAARSGQFAMVTVCFKRNFKKSDQCFKELIFHTGCIGDDMGLLHVFGNLDSSNHFFAQAVTLDSTAKKSFKRKTCVLSDPSELAGELGELLAHLGVGSETDEDEWFIDTLDDLISKVAQLEARPSGNGRFFEVFGGSEIRIDELDFAPKDINYFVSREIFVLESRFEWTPQQLPTLPEVVKQHPQGRWLEGFEFLVLALVGPE